MKFDKTCCGTTCDAKANAEYVAKLEKFIMNFSGELGFAISGFHVYAYKAAMLRIYEENKDLIKHAQQNNSTNGAS